MLLLIIFNGPSCFEVKLRTLQHQTQKNSLTFIYIFWVTEYYTYIKFILMKLNFRTRSSQNYQQAKILSANSLEKIKQSLPLPLCKPINFQPKQSRYTNLSDQNQQQNKAAFVKNLIDNYFQQEERSQKKISLFNKKHSNFNQNNRISRRSKILSQHLVPLQNTATNTTNYSKVDSQLPAFEQKDKQRENNSRLPPIHELTEEAQQRQNLNQSALSGNLTCTTTSFYFRSTSAFSEYLNPEAQLKQTKVKSFQNQIFTIYVLLQNGRAVARIKEFKPAGESVLARQMKMLAYDIPKVWYQSKINSITFETGMQPPLKDMLFKMKPDELNPSHVRIYPRPLSKKLKANQCQELRILLKGFCQDFAKLQGKVINNKLNLGNLFLTKQYKLCLAEWGHSSFRETFNIQLNTFESRQKGHLQGQHSWLVSPQYLAPEIIAQIIGQQSQDVWDVSSSPDIWSLGLTLFQILTFIPIWTVNRCFLVGRPHVIRAGILNAPGRDLHKLYQKQMSIQRTVKKCFQMELQIGERQIGSLILRMLDSNPCTRITWDEIIRQL